VSGRVLLPYIDCEDLRVCLYVIGHMICMINLLNELMITEGLITIVI